MSSYGSIGSKEEVPNNEGRDAARSPDKLPLIWKIAPNNYTKKGGKGTGSEVKKE